MINLTSIDRIINLMRKDVDIFDPQGNPIENTQVSSLIVLKCYENNKDFSFKGKEKFQKLFENDYKKANKSDEDGVEIDESHTDRKSVV